MEVDRSWFADIHQPLGRVWNALTADKELSAWFDPGASLESQAGGRFLAPSGTQFRGKFKAGKLLLIQDRQEMIFDWPLAGSPSQVLWLLSPTKAGTRLGKPQFQRPK